MDIENFMKKIEEKYYVINYRFMAGNDFKNNILFLIETLIRPIFLIIERNEMNSYLEDIINEYNIKYIIKNSSNFYINSNDKYDKFYLNY